MKPLAAILLALMLSGCIYNLPAGPWWMYPVQPGCTCSDGTKNCCQ